MNEDELREMLRAKAGGFAARPLDPEVVVARARRRTTRKLLRSSMAAAVCVVAGLVGVAKVAERVTPAESAFAAFTLNDPGWNDGAAAPHAQDDAGERITRPKLDRHNDCMRAQGFDLPDPVETPSGWRVIVEESDGAPLPSESPDPNVRKRWAEAVFVECRLMNVGDDLVLGGRSRAQIDSLVDCARDEGFVLPSPRETRPGEFTFDLDATSPAWGSEAWYRTVFVTCGLWRFAP